MYVKSKNRIISEHDLVKIRIVIVNELDDDDDNDIEIYPDFTFSHGYTNEINDEIPLIIKTNLDKIIDKFATINVQLEEIDIENLKLSNLKAGNRLQINVVEVMQFDFKWNLSENEKVTVSTILKNRGNYKAGLKLWSDAFKNYHKAVKYLKSSVCISDASFECHVTARQLLISCMNNVAVACLKLHSGYLLCVKYCDHILGMDATNTKALYRKAKALLETKHYQSALDSIDKCLLLESDEKARKEILDMKVKCLYKHKIQQSKDKLLCQDIFDKMGDLARKSTDNNKSSIPYDIEGWDNAMADQMLSITEELEAFGEQMPPRITLNNRNGDHFSIIEEEDDFE